MKHALNADIECMAGAYAAADAAMAAPVLIQLKPPQVGHLATHLDNRLTISKRQNKIFLVRKIAW